MADLDHANAYVAAQAMETGADAIAASGKYPAASAFLKRFAGILLDMAGCADPMGDRETTDRT